MPRISKLFTSTTIVISLFMSMFLLSTADTFEILSHYEILTGDCETVLQCRATLTIGRVNGDIVIAAGYVIRNTFHAVPLSEYVAISAIPAVKNWTQYAVSSVQLAITYHADKSAPVQCQLHTDSMTMAIYHSMFFATRSCSDIGQPACEQYRLLGPCSALPSATATATPSSRAFKSSKHLPFPSFVLGSASVTISKDKQNTERSSQLPIISFTVSPVPTTTKLDFNVQSIPITSPLAGTASSAVLKKPMLGSSDSRLPEVSLIPPHGPFRSMPSTTFVSISTSQTPDFNSFIAPTMQTTKPSRSSLTTSILIPRFSKAPLVSATAAAPKPSTTVGPALFSSASTSTSLFTSTSTPTLAAKLPPLSATPPLFLATPSSSAHMLSSPYVSGANNLSLPPIPRTPAFNLSSIQPFSSPSTAPYGSVSAAPSIPPNKSLGIAEVADTTKASTSQTTSGPMNLTSSHEVSVGDQNTFAVKDFNFLREFVKKSNLSISFSSGRKVALLAPSDAAFVRIARYLSASPDVQNTVQPFNSSSESNWRTILNILTHGVRFRNVSLSGVQFAQMILQYHMVIDPIPAIGTGASLHTLLGVPIFLTRLGEAVDQSPDTPNGVISRNVLRPHKNFHIHAIDAVMIPYTIAVNKTRVYNCQL